MRMIFKVIEFIENNVWHSFNFFVLIITKTVTPNEKFYCNMDETESIIFEYGKFGNTLTILIRGDG